MSKKTAVCPSCQKKALEQFQTTLDIPHFGESLLLTFKCRICNFKKTDVLSLTKKPAQKFVFHVKTLDHLKVRIVKSSQAIVKIPEFQFVSTPGPKAQGFIGNIETLLEQVESTILTLKKWTKDDAEKRKQLVELELQLKKTRKEGSSFTVIFEDPSGNSAILPDPPDKVEIYPLPETTRED